MFSRDLATIINLMLQTNPNRRPSCEEILKNEIISKKQNLFKVENNNETEPPVQLLATIKLPKNMNEINQRLPKMKMYAKEK